MKTYRGYFTIIIFFYASKIVFSQQHDSIASANWMDTIVKPEEKCKSYLDTAFVYYKNADYSTFKKYNDSVLSVSRKFNLPKPEVKALINIGIYYNLRGSNEKSLSFYHKALNVCDDHNPAMENQKIDILVNMGNVYNKIELYDKAIANMEKAIVMSELYNISGVRRGALYNILGNGYSKINENEKALEYYYKLKCLGESMENEEGVITGLANISNTHFTMENYQESIKVGKECLAYSAEKRIEAKPEVVLNIAMSYVKLGEPDRALPYLNDATGVAVSKNNLNLERSCRLYLSRAYELKGDFEKSFKEQKRYSELNDTLLKDRTEAVKLDVKHDADNEKKVVKQELESLTKISEKKDKTLIGSGVALVFLGGMLFFYIKKKKAVEQEREKINQNYSALYDEHLGLKTKLKELAEKKEKKHADEQQTKSSPRYKNSSLTPKDREQYMDLILDYMEKEKPYLDFDMNQSELASKLSMSSYHLSEVLSICFEQNFYNFINIYRVNEAQRLMKNPTYSDYKILAIAYESGFKSKTSFNRVFKNHIGLTPTEYRKKE